MAFDLISYHIYVTRTRRQDDGLKVSQQCHNAEHNGSEAMPSYATWQSLWNRWPQWNPEVPERFRVFIKGRGPLGCKLDALNILNTTHIYKDLDTCIDNMFWWFWWFWCMCWLCCAFCCIPALVGEQHDRPCLRWNHGLHGCKML